MNTSPNPFLSLSHRALAVLVLYPAWVTGYMTIAHLTVHRTVGSVRSLVDSHLPFWSIAIVPYQLAYLQLVVCAALLPKREDFSRLLYAFLWTSVLTFAIYLIAPTEAPAVYTPLPEHIFGRLVGLQYAMDSRVNCFPSFHCSLTTLGTLGTWHLSPRWRNGNIAFTLVVVASTVLLKQHWLLCIPAGIGMSCFAWWLAGLHRRPI